MILAKHIATAATGVASYYISNTLIDKGMTHNIDKTSNFTNLFASVIREGKLGQKHSTIEIIYVIELGGENIQDPRSDLGQKQIHNLCVENFGEDLCNDLSHSYLD